MPEAWRLSSKKIKNLIEFRISNETAFIIWCSSGMQDATVSILCSRKFLKLIIIE